MKKEKGRGGGGGCVDGRKFPHVKFRRIHHQSIKWGAKRERERERERGKEEKEQKETGKCGGGGWVGEGGRGEGDEIQSIKAEREWNHSLHSDHSSLMYGYGGYSLRPPI